MAEVVVFTDAEALTVAYLRAQLTARGDTARVATEVPNPRPTRLVKVTRTGGPAVYPATDTPTITVQCWDDDTVDASGLCRLTRALLWALPADATHGADIRKVVEVGGPAFFPDPATDLPRYQFSVQLNVRGAAL